MNRMSNSFKYQRKFDSSIRCKYSGDYSITFYLFLQTKNEFVKYAKKFHFQIQTGISDISNSIEMESFDLPYFLALKFNSTPIKVWMKSWASIPHFTTVWEGLGSIPTQDSTFLKLSSPFLLTTDCKTYSCNIIYCYS